MRIHVCLWYVHTNQYYMTADSGLCYKYEVLVYEIYVQRLFDITGVYSAHICE